MYTYEVPVTKTVNALLGFLKDDAAVEELLVSSAEDVISDVRLTFCYEASIVGA